MRAVIAGAVVWLAAAGASAQDGSARALLQQARQQSSDGQAAAALETLRRARALAPNSEEILSAYARTALAARAPMPAIAVLEPLTRMCPTVADYQYLLGVALLQAGDPVTADNPLRAAEALEPDRPLTLIALGLALNNRKLYADAKPFLLRSLELQPESLEATAALAESEEGLDELESAESHARRVLGGAGDNPTAHLVLGMVAMKRGQYTQARDSLLRAVSSDATLQKAHYQLSLVYARLGDEASSSKHLELYRKSLQETQDRMKAMRAR